MRYSIVNKIIKISIILLLGSFLLTGPIYQSLEGTIWVPIAMFNLFLPLSLILILRINTKIRIRSYSTTKGTIESSRIKRQLISYFGDEHSSAIPSYRAHLTISYTVNGYEYQTRQKTEITRDRNGLEQTYAQGKSITLLHDPHDPKSTSLTTNIGFNRGSAIFHAIVAIFPFGYIFFAKGTEELTFFHRFLDDPSFILLVYGICAIGIMFFAVLYFIYGVYITNFAFKPASQSDSMMSENEEVTLKR